MRTLRDVSDGIRDQDQTGRLELRITSRFLTSTQAYASITEAIERDIKASMGVVGSSITSISRLCRKGASLSASQATFKMKILVQSTIWHSAKLAAKCGEALYLSFATADVCLF